MNNRLYGHIKEEYSIAECIPDIENFLLSLVEIHKKEYPTYLDNILPNNTLFKTKEMWINLQKQYEFNPMHTHAGIYSFVIWLNIPFDIELEKNTFITSEHNNISKSSTFEFVYTNVIGEIKAYTLWLDNSVEGTICLFPAKLNHLVNPFYTSNGTRVSISGNIFEV